MPRQCQCRPLTPSNPSLGTVASLSSSLWGVLSAPQRNLAPGEAEDDAMTTTRGWQDDNAVTTTPVVTPSRRRGVSAWRTRRSMARAGCRGVTSLESMARGEAAAAPRRLPGGVFAGAPPVHPSIASSLLHRSAQQHTTSPTRPNLPVRPSRRGAGRRVSHAGGWRGNCVGTFRRRQDAGRGRVGWGIGLGGLCPLWWV